MTLCTRQTLGVEKTIGAGKPNKSAMHAKVRSAKKSS